jgi:putative multiple sugar transport system substrate-binding protein
MKKIVSLVLLALLVVGLSACGDSKKIKIGVVLPDASEERWANQDGAFFLAELTALGEGYEFEILFSEGDESKEVQNVEALIAKGAEVIILTAEGSGAGAVQAAHQADVILIAHDRMAKSATDHADYYTTFNSWNVGKAMGLHLKTEAQNEGCTVDSKCDLAIFAGRVADWPNATYFFGGAMEELQPVLNIFNIINVSDTFSGLGFYTEATFNDAAKNALQAAMLPVDTDWNSETAATKAQAVVAQLGDADKSDQPLFVLAPNDDTSTAIRQEFAEMTHPYESYYTTGQDAANITLASLMGDPVKGKGVQTMTVFKDVRKLVADSVKIAKNIIDDKPGLTGLTSGPSIDGAQTAYSPIDTLTIDNKQNTYDIIFATGYKSKNDDTFSNINWTPYE